MSKMIDVKTLTGITQDSRRVKKGFLFAALPGARTDGGKFIETAIQNGAVAILVPTGVMLPAGVSEDKVALIADDNPRRAFALLAAEYYGAQPGYIAAVTGTNGKTSTVHFARQLWKQRDIKAASLGTLGIGAPGVQKSGSMTTPDPETLHAELADLAAVGVTHLALEASSHGLHQHRLDGVDIKAAAFTNLSHDHLDYHETLEEYLGIKTLLFSEVMKPGGTAVLNADSDHYETLKEAATQAGHSIISFGFKGEDMRIVDVHPAPKGQAVTLDIFGQRYDLTIPLVGAFQIKNALCALGLVLAEDPKMQDDYVAGLQNLQGAPGRLELISGHPKNAAVYVDYAHTPAALENVLKALRPHTSGKLACVFGCGGDRDEAKRAVMGAAAAELADIVIVTDDNPRSEAPEKIRASILEVAPEAKEIADRGAAISEAIQNLDDGDVLVIAGKGHERGQVYAERTVPFDDCAVARQAIEELKDNE